MYSQVVVGETNDKYKRIFNGFQDSNTHKLYYACETEHFLLQL